jgi:threonine dehydrogenase-like Zn-dependent dehydrogenase
MAMAQKAGAIIIVDAVGTEAHAAASFDSRSDRLKVATWRGMDRPHVLRQAVHNTRNFGVVSVIGVHGGLLDNIPVQSAINRGLTFRMAQTPVQHYLTKLMKFIEDGRIDPSFVITHKVALEEGPEMYRTFRDKQHGCIKVMTHP